MKKAITKLWVFLFCPMWSCFINLGYIIFNLPKYNDIKEQKKILLASTLQDCMSKFIWDKDNLKDWHKWVCVLIAHNFTGDCEDAALLAMFWLRKHNIKADLFFMYDSKFKEGHAVCVTKDRETMVTNERVVNLNPTCWEKEMLEYFGNKYTVII